MVESIVVTALLLLLLQHVTADYDMIKDYKGRACTRRCYKQKKGEEYYVCFVNADHDWGYCSPQPGKTSKNKVCKRNHQCEKHGEDHYWCKTEGGSWDYCSPLSERRSGSRWVDADGFYCKDNCDYRGSTYTWCHSDNNQGWGFCSKIQNVATNGKKCKDDSPCRKDGTHYYFCYTEGGGWDYCGDVEDEKRTIDPPCDFSNPSSRVDCGWSGILQAQCESIGCCHDATYKDHYNCFYKHVDCAKLIFHAADNWYTLETNGDSRTGVQAWRYSNFTLTDSNYDLKKGAVSECSEKDSVLNRDIYNQVVHRLTDQQGNMAGQIKIIEPNDDGNPIQAVHVRLLDHVGADGHVSRVEALRAVIRPSHVKVNNRADFPWNTKQYMLDKLNGEAQDEVFRLVDSELGGPPELYNMIPGHNSVNIIVNPPNKYQSNDWRSVEIAMRRHLETHPDGRVEWIVLLFYPNVANSGRPTHILYVATLFNSNESQIGDSFISGISFNGHITRIKGYSKDDSGNY